MNEVVEKNTSVNTPTFADEKPVLRTLSPMLKELEGSIRAWLSVTHRFPCPPQVRTTLESLARDLHRQAEALDADQPLLVIMLMGGTGVGKSTLLNALAGGTIAQASYARPTTRDPVVYFHESVKPERLDKGLQYCRLKQHDRPALEQKILVDTPDLDSNDLVNRDKLQNLLPVADIILYVGSQEKYHDKLGWELFLQQRQRRAFAFVLNKWDRCLQAGASGLRPDEDLLKDLKAEGFQNPLLFRTNAQFWVDRASGVQSAPTAVPVSDGNAMPGGPAAAGSTAPVATAVAVAIPLAAQTLPEGEQFADLTHWLEMGLSRLEIEAIKARGVSQLLTLLIKTLEEACPPELQEAAAKTRAGWSKTLADEAASNAAILLHTLEPYQKEIEHHFAMERQSRFRGLMASYLHLFNRMKYAGSALRDRIPFMPKGTTRVATPSSWDLGTFTRACSTAASDRSLDARTKALANRLLVDADSQGFPIQLLSEPTEATARIDWRQRYSQSLVEVLGHVEHQWTRPSGWRAVVQTLIVFLADWLPLVTLGAVASILLWGYTVSEPPRRFEWSDLFLLGAAVLMVLIILHVLIAVLLPLRWPVIRGEFQQQLERRLHTELDQAFAGIPVQVAEVMKNERAEVHKLLAGIGDTTHWLEQREQAANIAAMYGH